MSNDTPHISPNAEAGPKTTVALSHHAAQTARDNLLLRLKEHDQSALIPHTLLYEQTHRNFEPLTQSSLVWSVSGGSLGDEIFKPAGEEEIEAADALLERGALVRSFARSAMGGLRLCRIQHTEDVNWGVDDNGLFYMFRLRDAGPDEIPATDESHDAAISFLQRQIDFGKAFIDARKITLSNGTALAPVIQGKNAVLLHQRQQQQQQRFPDGP